MGTQLPEKLNCAFAAHCMCCFQQTQYPASVCFHACNTVSLGRVQLFHGMEACD